MKKIIVLLIMIGLSMAGASRAQSLQWPIAALVGPFGSEYGDIWIYGAGAWQQRTAWGYNRQPVFAPNGQALAYASLASVAKEAMTGSQPRGTIQPHTIWVIPNIGASDEGDRVASQPDGATYDELAYENDTFIARSDPTWSPDSLQLAWVEAVYPQVDYFLAVYTLQTEQTERFPIAGPPATAYNLGQVLWGQAAILVAFWGESATLYSPQGERLADLAIQRTDGWWAWVQHEGREYLGLDLDIGRFALFDPLTGQQIPFAGEFRRAAVGSTSPYVVATYEKEASRGWTIVTPDGQSLRLVDGLNPDLVALAPDGLTWAFANSRTLQFWSGDGVSESVALALAVDVTQGQIRSLSWAPVQWFTGSSGEGWRACTSGPPSRLSYAMTGRVAVTDGQPLNLRDDPNRTAPVLAQLPEGTAFLVVGGPTCADGLTWWEVNVDDLWGWVAESSAEGGYWIEPQP
jgi:hypothetical protein